MKKIIIVLLACIFLLNFNSCADKNTSYSIKNALKISTWVLSENIESNYWEVSDRVLTDDGWYNVERDDVGFEQLKLNEVKIMTPFNWMNMANLNIFVEFDGVIEVEPEDKYITVSYNDKNPSQPGMGSSGNVKVPYAVYVNVCPLVEIDLAGGIHNIRNDIKKTDREYYLNVNAYNFGNEETPVIRARLKLVVLEDKTIPLNYDSSGFYVGEERSRFLSIELISYEYSDRYKLLDEMFWDDENDD